MRSIEQIKKKLENLKSLLKGRFRVKSIGIFGSYLKGEQKRKSDLDVLVEFSEAVGLFKFIQLEDFLSKELDVKVDLVMKDGLKPLIKEQVLKEVVYL